MLYTDKPIHDRNEDLLGRSCFARQTAKALIGYQVEDTFTIGLFGHWGSGKTSLINMILYEIGRLQMAVTSKEKYIIVHFDPWNFSDPNQLLSQFFVRLASVFQSKSDKSMSAIGQALEQYSEAFGAVEMIPVVGTSASKITTAGIKALGRKDWMNLAVIDI